MQLMISCGADLPEAPSAVSVRYKSSTIICLDVEPPVDDGGEQIIAYHIYYDQGRVLEFQTGKYILFNLYTGSMLKEVFIHEFTAW